MKDRIFANPFFKINKKRLSDIYARATNTNFLLGFVTILWMVIFLIVPLIIVLRTSFAESSFGTPPYTEISRWTKEHFIQICLNLHNYFVLFRDTYYKTAFFNSIALSTIATMLCLIIGYMMAYAIANLKEKQKTIFIILISLSFWTSFLIRIYSWMNLLSSHGLINTILLKFGIISSPIQFLGNYYAICLGTVFCYLPFMIFPIYAVMEKVDKSCIEAASDLGANPFKAFWMITIPLTKYGIITGCTLVFTTTIGEFIVPELLGGPDSITVGRVMWIEFFNNIDWPMACALSVVLTLFIILPIFTLQKRTSAGEA